MCASITWTKIATTTFCATCSTNVQKARARRVDVGPTQGSWSLQSEQFLPLSSISFDILLRTLYPDDLTCVGHESTAILVRFYQGVEIYPSYSPSQSLLCEVYSWREQLCWTSQEAVCQTMRVSIRNRSDHSTISTYITLRWPVTGHSLCEIGDS